MTRTWLNCVCISVLVKVELMNNKIFSCDFQTKH